MRIGSQGVRLLAESVIGVVLRIGSAVAQLVVAVFLGRTIGAAELGTFFGWFSAVTLLSAFARAGSGGVVLKTYRDNGDSLAEVGDFRAFQRMWSVFVAAVALLVQLALGIELRNALVVAATVSLLAELGVNSEVFRAIRRVSLSQALFPLGPNVVFLVLLAITPTETAFGAVERWAVSIAFVALVSAALTKKPMKIENRTAEGLLSRSLRSARLYRKDASRIAAAELTTMSATWLPGLALPFIATSSVAGVFGGATRVVRPLLIVQAAVNHSLGPRLITKEGRIAVDAASAGSALSLTLVSPFALFVLFGAEWILSIFGENFVSGAPALRILIITYFLALGVGPVNLLLNLSGRAKQSARIALTGLAALAALLLLAESEVLAAVAVSTGVLLRSVLAAQQVSKIEGRWIVPRFASARRLLEQRR